MKSYLDLSCFRSCKKQFRWHANRISENFIFLYLKTNLVKDSNYIRLRTGWLNFIHRRKVPPLTLYLWLLCVATCKQIWHSNISKCMIKIALIQISLSLFSSVAPSPPLSLSLSLYSSPSLPFSLFYSCSRSVERSNPFSPSLPYSFSPFRALVSLRTEQNPFNATNNFVLYLSFIIWGLYQFNFISSHTSW